MRQDLYTARVKQTESESTNKTRRLVHSEDWMTVWLAAAAIILVLAGFKPQIPALRWSDSLAPVLSSSNLFRAAIVCAEYLVLSAIGVRLLGGNLRSFVAGFPFVYLI